MTKRQVKVNANYETITLLYGYLIKRYGNGEELQIFNICSYNGIDLSGSTIDKISFEHGGQDIMFYYNENTNDCDILNEFKLKDLASFYNKLLCILESGKN